MSLIFVIIIAVFVLLAVAALSFFAGVNASIRACTDRLVGSMYVTLESNTQWESKDHFVKTVIDNAGTDEVTAAARKIREIRKQAKKA